MTIGWVIRAYFALNVLLYGAIAVRTTLRPDAAALAAGLAPSSPAGRSEFLTVYAGQTLALAAIFTIFLTKTDQYRVGLVVGIVFYASIVVFRIIPALVNRSSFAIAGRATIAEITMLVAGMALYLMMPRA